jgi:hypothetical protein
MIFPTQRLCLQACHEILFRAWESDENCSWRGLTLGFDEVNGAWKDSVGIESFGIRGPQGSFPIDQALLGFTSQPHHVVAFGEGIARQGRHRFMSEQGCIASKSLEPSRGMS